MGAIKVEKAVPVQKSEEKDGPPARVDREA